MISKKISEKTLAEKAISKKTIAEKTISDENNDVCSNGGEGLVDEWSFKLNIIWLCSLSFDHSVTWIIIICDVDFLMLLMIF